MRILIFVLSGLDGDIMRSTDSKGIVEPLTDLQITVSNLSQSVELNKRHKSLQGIELEAVIHYF